MTLRFLRLLPVMGLVLAGCNKEDNNAFVNLINVSPDAPPVNMVINGQPLLQNVTAAGGTYAKAPSGNVSLVVQPSGGGSTYLSTSLVLSEDRYFTVVIADSVKRIKSSLVVDDLSAPPANSAKLRFFHLAPNAPAVDIRMGDTRLFVNRSFNDQANTPAYATFNIVPAGNTQNFSVLLAGTNQTVLNIPNVPVEAGKIYTVIARTQKDANGQQSVGAVVVPNN